MSSRPRLLKVLVGYLENAPGPPAHHQRVRALHTDGSGFGLLVEPDAELHGLVTRCSG